MPFKHVLMASAALCLLTCPISAAAQTAENIADQSGPIDEAGTQQYVADYFTQYAPRAASDMVDYIPGFSVSEADNKRGLGQGGANVLINGARLTGKTSARDQLGRIAAANVVRIEILDGATLNIPGLSGQVANIITDSTGITGIWEWSPRFRREATRWGQGEVSVSGERGTLAYTLLASIGSRRSDDDGPEFLRSVNGELLEDSLINTQNYSETYKIGTDLNWSPRDGHNASLSAEYTLANNNRGESAQISVLPTLTETDTISEISDFSRGEDEWNARIGADYEFPFLAGRLKLIGAHRSEHSPIGETAFDYVSDALTKQRIRDLVQDEAESILRSEYSWQTQKGHDLQLSAEAAFNYLDNDDTLTEITPTETNTGQTVARVEEKRAELTLTYGRALTEKLDVQSSIGAEYSELTQTTLGVEEPFVRDFIRPKGFISAAYKYDNSLIIRSRIEREVGQLNFNNFIPSVDLQNGFDNSGNPDLVPQQAWLVNIELDKKFTDGINFQAKIYGALVSDTVDRIPFGDDGDAVGNLEDDAIRYGLELSGEAKWDSFGWPGIQTDFALNLRETEVDDPLTGQARPLSNSQQYQWNIGYRHDIVGTDWAYGGFISQSQNYDNYRVKAIIRNTTTQPRTSVYVEHKDLWGVKAQARLLNFLDEAQERTETRYSARRDIGLIEQIETNSLKGHLFAQFSFSGTF